MSTPSKSGAMSAMARELARTDTLKIDRVLTPVRECLEGLRTMNGCWCFQDVCEGHTLVCEATKQLWEGLKVDE